MTLKNLCICINMVNIISFDFDVASTICSRSRYDNKPLSVKELAQQFKLRSCQEAIRAFLKILYLAYYEFIVINCHQFTVINHFLMAAPWEHFRSMALKLVCQ